jgi:hypothetical protein
MTTEARITINRSPAAPRKEGRLNPARQANEAVGEQIRRRRKKIHDQARIDAAVTEQQQEAAKTAEPPPPREDIDSIEVPLRNGMTVEYGPPNGISLLDRIARFYGGRDPSVSEFRLTRVLMGVREINGRPVPPLTNEVERTKLANRIGDEGIDLLFYYDRTYWPPLRQAELPVAKKKYRVTSTDS